MVVVSYSGKELNAKIVYYGPGLGGKTTNLERLYDAVPAANKGKMISMKTKSDRTLFFDFLPLELGEIAGFRTRFMLYTVPGQVYYNATRKLVLKGVDGVVFVADSERGKMRENRASLENLRENLISYGLDLDQLPLVYQYNKRDLAGAYTREELDQGLGRGARPVVEAAAAKGEGVMETLRAISELLLARLREKLQAGSMAPGAGAPGGPPSASAEPVTRAPAVPAATMPAGPPDPAASPRPEPLPLAVRRDAAPAELRSAEPSPAEPRPVDPRPAAPRPQLEIVRLDAGVERGAAAARPRRVVVPVEIDARDLAAGAPLELVLRITIARDDPAAGELSG